MFNFGQTKRLQVVVQSRDAQYRHGMKKKEMELVKLKDRLHSLLVDKTDQKIGEFYSFPYNIHNIHTFLT